MGRIVRRESRRLSGGSENPTLTLDASRGKNNRGHQFPGNDLLTYVEATNLGSFLGFTKHNQS